jgi:hypothetical protein
VDSILDLSPQVAAISVWRVNLQATTPSRLTPETVGRAAVPSQLSGLLQTYQA